MLRALTSRSQYSKQTAFSNLKRNGETCPAFTPAKASRIRSLSIYPRRELRGEAKALSSLFQCFAIVTEYDRSKLAFVFLFNISGGRRPARALRIRKRRCPGRSNWSSGIVERNSTKY